MSAGVRPRGIAPAANADAAQERLPAVQARKGVHLGKGMSVRARGEANIEACWPTASKPGLCEFTSTYLAILC